MIRITADHVQRTLETRKGNQMTNTEIMDLAMRTATGNLTTAILSYDEFQDENLDITEFAWEPFEHVDEETYNDMIDAEYQAIYKALITLNNSYQS